jgi:copper transport outer membrane protein MctB
VRPWLVRAAVAALALALGIGLGAGPLQHSNSERDKELATQKAAVARKQRQVDSLQATAAFADAFATAAGPTLTRGALAGRSIAVITLPGADPAVVDRLKAEVAAAQGQITTQVALAPTMARSSSRQLVEALTSQMLTQAKGLDVPADAGGYGRFGALLARAVGTGSSGQPAQAPYDATAVGIVSGLQSAELVTTPQPVSARAGLALVVTGPAARTDAAAAENAVPVTILRALGAQLPTVVVGSTAAAGSRGVLGALRASDARSAVSTVDSLETAMGRVAAVLALAARARGTIGQFGAVNAADGAIPGAKH